MSWVYLTYPNPPEVFNSEFTPKNGWLQYDPVLLGKTAYFQGRTVSFRGGKSPIKTFLCARV